MKKQIIAKQIIQSQKNNGNFKVRHIPIEKLEEEIISNYNEYEVAKPIGNEMVQVIRRINLGKLKV